MLDRCLHAMVNRCTREVTDGHVSLPEVRVPEVRVFA
jgi:hypothetical protein